MKAGTGLRDIRTINDSINMNNLKYYEAVVLGVAPGLDTIRIDSTQNLLIYKKGKERIFYKFNAKVGDSWDYIDTLYGEERTYRVTLESRTDTVKTFAGIFIKCLNFILSHRI